VKHSNASEVKVKVRSDGGKIVVTVRDNGRGFNAAAASVYDGEKGGFGLFSIREKVSRLGGAFRLSSRHGSGTLAVITAPLGKDKRNGKKAAYLR
jgi:signal transduction histidine kinase